MRLPADATLILVGAQETRGDPRRGAGDDRGVGAKVAELIAVWRREALPVVHAPLDGASGAPFETWAAPLVGEIVVGAGAAGAFAGSGLEALLDEAGATTLVLCGPLGALEPTVRDAASLGYHVFIPLDACGPAARFADPAVERLRREGAAVVDTAAALAAAAMATWRRRREAGRRR